MPLGPLGPRLGLVVHGQINQDRSRGRTRAVLDGYCFATSLIFFAHARRMGRTEGWGVSCAAVLLVRLALPLPVLHPSKREGYKIYLTIAQ